MEGFKLKKFVVVSFVILSLLVMSFQTADVAGNQSKIIVSPDENQVPIVNSPIDIVYVEGSTGHNITWEISDDNPAYWITTRNGDYLSAMAWETLNETVPVDVDGLAAGNYEFKIYACDGIYNITDVVLVAVLSTDIEVDLPFMIYGNEQFNTTAQAEGWVGNGTATNPYIIEKLYIEASSRCIGIYGTTVHFVIRNCTFIEISTEYTIGVEMQSVNNGVVENCTFANLWIGSITWFSSNCTWESNLFGNVIDGIWLNEAMNCTIVDNSFMSGGISISGYSPTNWVHEISGNMVRDRPIGYYEGLSSLYIDVEDYGQIIIANCSDVDIFNGDFSNAGSAISIAHSNATDVSYCEISGGRFGIYMERTQNTTIDTCHIIGSSEVGMYINETTSTEVFNCSMQNIGFIGAQVGMGLETRIIQSIIQDCGDKGIICYDTPGIEIVNCTVQENHEGIDMGGCPDSLIFGNIIQNNDVSGFTISWGSENTIIFGNKFLSNGLLNARDDGTDTYWDDGVSVGNMWSDYGGVGFYYVPGSRNGIDHYPEGLEFTLTEIYDTADISYTVGTTGHNIVWEVNCTFTAMYTIYKDGVVLRNQLLYESSISQNIDGLSIGVYNYTLEMQDGVGGTVSDTVFVTVVPADPTIITNTTTTTTTTTNATDPIGMQEITLIISIGSTVVIVVIIVLIVRSRNQVM